MFGICFGNQSMAHALGGTVVRSPVAEVGWHSVGTMHPDIIAEGPWMQWHYDVVTLPPGAELMAANDVGPQAWRIDRMFCTQFHPEVTETVVHRWSSGPGGNELAKLGHKYAEQARVAVRNVRRDGMDSLKTDEKKGEISEDERKRLETEVQKLTDSTIADIDAASSAKEKEILGQ